jgi:hypothetical protein
LCSLPVKLEKVGAMPIRFRCAFCNQLMGIAHRKAGAVVSCPKCQGKVIVPSPDTLAAPPAVNGPKPTAPEPGPVKGPRLFEHSDFENILAPNPMIPKAPASLPELGDIDVEPLGSPELLGPGILLSPNKLTAISVAIVILLGLAFFLGMLVGRA